MWSFILFCLVIVVRVFGDVQPGENKIIQGQEVLIEQFPYQIAYLYDNKFFCGGFIVSDTFMVTAAHCVPDDADPSKMTVRVGSDYYNNGTIIPIAQAYRHPEYDPETIDKDVACLRVANLIQFSNTVKPIGLPSRGRPVKDVVTVSGWGRTENNATTISQRLMAVNLTVIESSVCNSTYSSLTENMWCGGNYSMGGPSACQGDSGGAAAQDGMAVGIVSYGRTCGAPKEPTVFTNVAAPDVYDFINRVTG